MPRHLLVATKNAHKTQEIQQILGSAWLVEDLNRHPEIIPPEETGITFAENAAIKAIAASKLFPGVVLSDDSGLEVDALGGEPGVQSARYSGEHGDDAANRKKLLTELAPLRLANPVCHARFRCSMAIAENGQTLATFDGTVEGKIIGAEKGEGGFGYDSLFVPDGFEQTFAELSSAIKNQLSHRARAMEKAQAFLSSQA